MRTRYLNKKSLGEAVRLFVRDLPLRARAVERVAVEESLGRVTAEPIFARLSVPHYHGSAMDGIAVRAEDTFGASEAAPAELQLVTADGGDVKAGARRRARAQRRGGVFAYVDTGQPLPAWANAVVMIENVYPQAADRVRIRAAAAPWQ